MKRRKVVNETECEPAKKWNIIHYVKCKLCNFTRIDPLEVFNDEDFYRFEASGNIWSGIVCKTCFKVICKWCTVIIDDNDPCYAPTPRFICAQCFDDKYMKIVKDRKKSHPLNIQACLKTQLPKDIAGIVLEYVTGGIVSCCESTFEMQWA